MSLDVLLLAGASEHLGIDSGAGRAEQAGVTNEDS